MRARFCALERTRQEEKKQDQDKRKEDRPICDKDEGQGEARPFTTRGRVVKIQQRRLHIGG